MTKRIIVVLLLLGVFTFLAQTRGCRHNPIVASVQQENVKS